MQRKFLMFQVPKRFIIVFMVFVGAMGMTYLHTNISMAVVEMTTLKNVSDNEGHNELKAEFNWTPQEKGLVLSSYYYGRLLCPLGGLLAGKFGGGTTYAIGYLAMSLIMFFTPFLLMANFMLFVSMYIIFGIFEAFLFGGVSQLFSRWAPPNERSKFVSFGVVGMYAGSAISFFISGWILKVYNWQILFYISGLVTFAWTCIWFFVVSNDPCQAWFINEPELQYIREQLNNDLEEKNLIYPWRDIFTSSALWIATLAEFTIVSGYIFTTVFLPQYIKDINNSDIQRIGYISTIPQIFAVVSMPICGCVCDYMRSHKILSVTNIHRLFASIGLISSAISYAVISLWADFVIDIVAMCIFQFFSTFTIIDLNVLILDFSPKYAAFLMSIVNAVATSSGVIVPVLVACIVTSHNLAQWNICFMIFSIMYCISAVFYLKFVSGKQATWAYGNGNIKPEFSENGEKKS